MHDPDFPLLLPNGTKENKISLPWDEDQAQDHAWIVEASTGHDAATATWTFGKVCTIGT